MPTYEQDLIQRAREVQRLATKRSKLNRQLKALDKELRAARKGLAAVRDASEGRRPDVAPSRLDGGVTGYVADKVVHAGSDGGNGTWCEKKALLKYLTYNRARVTCKECIAAMNA